MINRQKLKSQKLKCFFRAHFLSYVYHPKAECTVCAMSGIHQRTRIHMIC